MRYSLWSKIKFYASLAFYKLTSFLEVSNYKGRIFFNEVIFLFHTLNGYRSLTSDRTNTLILKSKFGTFKIRDIGIDITIASPSFERLDVDELMKRIREKMIDNHKVLFIDIGANFGKFTISVGNAFKKNSDALQILSFEPEKNSYKLLKENIRLNGLKNVKAYPTALSNKTGTQKFYYYEPMKQIVSFPTSKVISIKTRTLDSYMKSLPMNRYTDIFIKLDVEGHEIEVLDGGKTLINRNADTTLLIEDSMSNVPGKLSTYLLKHAQFITKHTSYNSFWKLHVWS